jgi:MinD-like ATPase involved in chromosome partitioning or flagellar assembly
LANHEQDETARTESTPPDAGRDGQPATGVPPSGHDGADGGTFRWPSTGLPRMFGQPVADEQLPGDSRSPGQAGTAPYLAGPPFTLDDYGDAASAPAPPAPGAGSAPGSGKPGAHEQGDVSQLGDVHQQAGAYQRPDLSPIGYGEGTGQGLAGEYDPPDGYPLAEYVADEEFAPPALPREEPPHRQRAETADSLTADLLLPGRHTAPPAGWRRMVYRATGGLIHPQQSAAVRHRRELITRACTPVATGHHRVAVLSLKGGVGKTTTVMGLGSMLSSLRGDRVIAVDANPDRGTLSDKLRLETAATVRDLLNERDQILRYADVRAFTTQAPSRLEVLASDRDPTISVAFSDRDYEDVAQVLEYYYSVCITDCGTGLLHSAMAGVLRLADQIVLVSSPSVDGARSASATLDWLQAHGYGDLVREGVVVLSVVRPRGKSTVDLGRLEEHFATRCRAVVRIPYDGHLEEGAEVDLSQLSRATADAYLALAAEVGDGFSRPRRGG